MTGTRVGVVYGGPSAEHEISVRSADVVSEALAAAGCDVLLAHLRRDGAWALARVTEAEPPGRAAARLAAAPSGIAVGDAIARLLADLDVVFPTMHGTLGEDGALQGFLSVLGIPCVGPELAASALAMDKARAKSVLSATTTLRMPRGVVVRRHDPAEAVAAARARACALPLPVIVKPNDAGSSVGLTRVERPEQFAEAFARANEVEGTSGVLFEELIAGDEVTCAVYGNPETGVVALPPILIRPHDGRLFDYETKYTPGLADEICPAPLAQAALAQIRAAAIDAYLALGCRGFARVDFILRDDVPWFLELNTLPGLTRESLVPKAALAAGFTLPGFFRAMVDLALAIPRAQARVAGRS